MTTILDIGCGIRPQTVHEGVTVGLEPCAEYREWLARCIPDMAVVEGSALDALPLFGEDSFDHVTILDVIEHLTREDGIQLIADACSIARASVTVYTPIGFLPQHPAPDGTDAWGLHGGEWQTHRSGWTPDDFDGWDIRIDEGEPTMFQAVWTP